MDDDDDDDDDNDNDNDDDYDDDDSKVNQPVVIGGNITIPIIIS